MDGQQDGDDFSSTEQGHEGHHPLLLRLHWLEGFLQAAIAEGKRFASASDRLGMQISRAQGSEQQKRVGKRLRTREKRNLADQFGVLLSQGSANLQKLAEDVVNFAVNELREPQRRRQGLPFAHIAGRPKRRHINVGEETPELVSEVPPGTSLTVGGLRTGVDEVRELSEKLPASELPASGDEDNLLNRRWLEQCGNVYKEYWGPAGEPDAELRVRVLQDRRPPLKKFTDGFKKQFFPVGYPDSVADGYLTYSKWRAVQHFTSAILGVLSTQAVLFAAGLRPTPAQATVVSWVLKEGMQHVGKLVGSGLGSRMDSDPKRWRVNADLMYDVGAGLEVISPVFPQAFLAVAGAANLCKGLALLAARSTRLPIYSAFAKEGNIADLYTKGEAISVLSNVSGMALGIKLASGFCATTKGKLMVAPFLSFVHVFCVSQEMRACPMNTLNAQRTALLIEDFVTRGVVSSPFELRYRERLILPAPLNAAAGSVKLGACLKKAFPAPSQAFSAVARFKGSPFLLSFHKDHTDLLLHRAATGEDALKGWLLAACAAKRAAESGKTSDREPHLDAAFEDVERLFPQLEKGVKEHGWHIAKFHEGASSRLVWDYAA